MIDAIELRNWKRFERLDVPLGPGLTVISGPNTAGKSSVLQAIAFALHGADAFPGMNKTDVGRFRKDPGAPASVTLRFTTIEGTHLVLERFLDGRSERVQLRDAAGNEITSVPGDLPGHAGGLVHPDADFARKSIVIGEGDIYTFFSKPHDSIMAEVDAFTGTGTFKKYQAGLEGLKSRKDKEFKAIQQKLKQDAAGAARGSTREVQARLGAIATGLAAKEQELSARRQERGTLAGVQEAFSEKTRHLDELARATARATALDGGREALLAEILAAVPGASQSTNPARVLDKAFQQLDRELATGAGQVDAVQGRIHENRAFAAQREAQRAQLSGAGGACPTCEQPLSVEHRVQVLAGIDGALQRLAAESPGLQAELDGAKRAQRELAGQREALTRLKDKLDRLDQDRAAAATTVRELSARGGIDAGFVAAQARRVQGIVELRSGDPPGVLVDGLDAAARALAASISSLEHAAGALRAEQAGLERSLQVQSDALEGEAAGLAHELFLLDCLLKTFTTAVDDFRDTQLSMIKVLVSDYFQRFRQGAQVGFTWTRKHEPAVSVQGAERPIELLSESEKLELCIGLHLSLLTHVSAARVLVIDEPFHAFSPENKQRFVEVMASVLTPEGPVDQVICTSLEPWASIPKPAGGIHVPVNEIRLA